MSFLISSVPLSSTCSLRFLDLNGNQLQQLPESFGDLQSLMRLGPFQSLPAITCLKSEAPMNIPPKSY